MFDGLESGVDRLAEERRPLTPEGVAVVLPVGVGVDDGELLALHRVDGFAVEPGVVAQRLERVVQPVAVGPREEDDGVVQLAVLEGFVGLLVLLGSLVVLAHRSGDGGRRRADGDRSDEQDDGGEDGPDSLVGQSAWKFCPHHLGGRQQADGRERHRRHQQVGVVVRPQKTDQPVVRIVQFAENVEVPPEEEVPQRHRQRDAGQRESAGVEAALPGSPQPNPSRQRSERPGDDPLRREQPEDFGVGPQ